MTISAAEQVAEHSAVVRLAPYVPGKGHTHRHGKRRHGWMEHSHLGGGIPHRHDPETGRQIPVDEEG